jgi:hypothetical protein
MLFGNFTVGSLFYTMIKQDLKLQTVKQILSQKMARRMYRKKGIDAKKGEKLESEIKELRAIVNKNVF